MMLNMPLVAYSQCAKIFKEGVALMEKKKYKSAKSYFKEAKLCDKNLAKQCDEKIRECDRKIKESVKDPIIKTSFKITLETQRVEFGEEHTAAKQVTVTSDADWTCSSNADWCKVTKTSKNKLSISCSINKTDQVRTANVEVKNDKEKLNIEVVQKGKVAVLNIIEPEYKFWRKGSDYFKIPIECNIEYFVNDDEWPEWLQLHELLPDKIIIKVAPIEFKWRDRKSKIAGERTFFIKISSSDKTKNEEVLIRQYDKKEPRPQEDDDERED